MANEIELHPMTWKGQLPLLLEIYTNSNPESAQWAKDELLRMANLADMLATFSHAATAQPSVKTEA